jgi:thioredoxin
VIYLTKASFIEKVWNYEESPEEWKYKGDRPCIVDFYADWCGPCRKIAPILDEIAKEYAGKIYIYKVNTDNERELASVFQVRGIPSILYVPMTGMPQMQSGAFPKESYVQMINTFMLAKQ